MTRSLPLQFSAGLVITACGGFSVDPAQQATVALVADGQRAPTKIASDGTKVYWVDPSAGVVMSATAGSNDTKVIASGHGSPSALAVEGSNVYWASEQGTFKTSVAAGTTTQLSTTSGQPQDIVISSGTPFWSETAQLTTNKGALSTVVAAGADPSLLVPADYPVGIAVDSANVYWADPMDGTVNAAPRQGGPATTLAFYAGEGQSDCGGGGGPNYVVSDDTSLYWTDSSGTINSMKLGTTNPVTLARPGSESHPEGVTVDADSIYWADPRLGVVMSIPKQGGYWVVLARDSGGPTGVAVDDTHVYWTDKYTGQIMMAAKKTPSK